MTYPGKRIPANDCGASEDRKDAGNRTIVLKWHEEIRACLNNRLVLATSLEIAENIAMHHALPPDQIVRQRVSATLTMMHQNMEIGRLKKHGGKSFSYGHRRYFEDDLKTSKQEYQDLLFD